MNGHAPMYREIVTAVAVSATLIAAGCGKDIENPDFPTSLRCSLVDDCKQLPPKQPPKAKPAAVVPTTPPATVVRPAS